MNRSTDKLQTLIAAVTMAPNVYTMKGERHPLKARWVADVVGTHGVTMADLWAAHTAGVLELTRCDLPYLFESETKHREGMVQPMGGTFHFVRVLR